MATTGTPQESEAEKQPQRLPEELEIIAMLERGWGRKLTEQEINLSLDQARALGELSGQPSKLSAVILRSPSCGRRKARI